MAMLLGNEQAEMVDYTTMAVMSGTEGSVFACVLHGIACSNVDDLMLTWVDTEVHLARTRTKLGTLEGCFGTCSLRWSYSELVTPQWRPLKEFITGIDQGLTL